MDSRRRNRKFRAGGWLPHDRSLIDSWISNLKITVPRAIEPFAPPIEEFRTMVDNDPALKLSIDIMFKEAAILKQQTPLGTPQVADFDEFLFLLNCIVSQAPQYIECPDSEGEEEPCGLIGFPINALLDWPMATNCGYSVFANALVNQQLKKILDYWSEYLLSKASRSVLVESYPNLTPKVLAWLSPKALQEMVDVACQASSDTAACQKQPFEHFFNCDPSDKYYGFKSWDDFFTRKFADGIRPVAQGDNIIANACESAPLQVERKVSATAQFWLKKQPYSLKNMMAFDPLTHHFIGGTVYQAFLSALSYHRWHSPVSGKVKKAFVVNGSYYLQNRYQGFSDPDGIPDPAGPNDSQPFITAVATRALIFIEADNPKIGLMCFIGVGMAEVSSCEITVCEGQHLEKGQEIGMFHFGGSTHCLVFRPEVKLEFDFHNTSPGLNATNIPVCSRIATIIE